MFNTGTVVPAAVEDHDFAGRREVLDVALEKQLALLPLGRRGQGDDPEYAWADSFGNRANGAAFAGCVTAFEGNYDSQAFFLTHSCR